MPLIHVDMSAGKATEAQKRQLIEQLTEAVSAVLGPVHAKCVPAPVPGRPQG